MKVGKTLQMLFSFLVAFALILPGAVKVSADDDYSVDPGAPIFEADFTGNKSTNRHTYAKALWTFEGELFLLVDSTHDLKKITLYSSSGGSITSDIPIVHGYTVIVEGIPYSADDSMGNVKDSHLTVFRFSLDDINGILNLNDGGSCMIDVISEQGKGHWIIGATLTISNPIVPQ